MSYENRDPLPVDPNAGSRRPMSSERWGEWEVDNEDDEDDEDTQPRRAISVPSDTSKPGSDQKDIPQPRQEQDQLVNSQFTHREHVTGAPPVYSSEAPLFRPTVSPPYPPQVPQQGAGYFPPQQWQGYPPQGTPQGMPPYQQQGYA
ncbi:MAG: hypothetical protein E6J36_09855, partial [Chloroflexi bacterium]